MITLDQRRWFVRWFFFSASVYSAFRNRPWIVQDMRKCGTNLCFFMRVSLVWAPLILLAHVALAAYAVYVFLIYPSLLFGAGKYFGSVGGIVVVILGLWGLAYWVDSHLSKVLVKLCSLLPARADRFTPASIPVKKLVHFCRKERNGPGFFRLMWEYTKAAKHAICPVIRFRPEEVGK